MRGRSKTCNYTITYRKCAARFRFGTHVNRFPFPHRIPIPVNPGQRSKNISSATTHSLSLTTGSGNIWSLLGKEALRSWARGKRLKVGYPVDTPIRRGGKTSSAQPIAGTERSSRSEYSSILVSVSSRGCLRVWTDDRTHLQTCTVLYVGLSSAVLGAFNGPMGGVCDHCGFAVWYSAKELEKSVLTR